MKYKVTYLAAALLILLAGCNLDEGKTSGEHKKKATDSPTVKLAPVEPQSTPEKGQYCDIVKVYEKGGRILIDADYVQFLMGKAAVAAAKKDGYAEMDINKKGDTVWSVPDDNYVVNDNKKIRTLTLAENVVFIGVEDMTSAPPAKLTVKYLQSVVKDNLFILRFGANGEVVQIKQQFIP